MRLHRTLGRKIPQIVLLVMGLGVAALLAEISARVLWPEWRVSAMAHETSAQAGVRISDGLGWERDQSSCPGVDEAGFFTRHDVGPRNETDYRILLLGDSVAEGATWPCSGNFERHAFVEDGLSRNTGRNVQLWNHSVGGYGLVQYERALIKKGKTVDPDLVLILFCLNDVDPYPIPVVWEKDGQVYAASHNKVMKPWPLLSWLFPRSHLVRTGWAVYNRYFPQTDAQDTYEDILKGSFANMVKWCRKRNAKLAAVVFPYFKPTSKYNYYEKRNRQMLLELFNDHGTAFIDLHEKFQPEFWKFYRQRGDDTHPNDAGNKAALEHIVEFLSTEI